MASSALSTALRAGFYSPRITEAKPEDVGQERGPPPCKAHGQLDTGLGLPLSEGSISLKRRDLVRNSISVLSLI